MMLSGPKMFYFVEYISIDDNIHLVKISNFGFLKREIKNSVKYIFRIVYKYFIA